MLSYCPILIDLLSILAAEPVFPCAGPFQTGCAEKRNRVSPVRGDERAWLAQPRKQASPLD